MCLIMAVEAVMGQELSRHFSQVEMLGMTARKDMINVEIRRCTKIKWLPLPFTLPIVPENLRIAALNAIHRVRGMGAGHGGELREYPYKIDDVVISADASPSVNLIAIAS